MIELDTGPRDQAPASLSDERNFTNARTMPPGFELDDKKSWKTIAKVLANPARQAPIPPRRTEIETDGKSPVAQEVELRLYTLPGTLSI